MNILFLIIALIIIIFIILNFDGNNNEKNKFYNHILFVIALLLYVNEMIPQIAFYIIGLFVLGYQGYLYFLSKNKPETIQSDEEE